MADQSLALFCAYKELFKKKFESWSQMSLTDGLKSDLSFYRLMSLSCNECRNSHLMPLKGFGLSFQDMKGGLGNISGKNIDLTGFRLQRPASYSTGYQERMQHADEAYNAEEQEQSYWATMPPELLRYIIQQVEECRSTWPFQIDVIACASVCRAWRDATKDVVKTPEFSGKLNFPISVTQPGPRDSLLQCFIKRDRITSTYHLYLSLTATLAEKGKFLLAARKLRRATGSDYIISLDAVDMCRGGETFVGKLRSNFLGTKFTVHEYLSPECHPDVSISCPNLDKRLGQKPTNQCLSRTLDVAYISYELNILGNKGPRRMFCTLYSVPGSAVEDSCKDCTSPTISLLKALSTLPVVEESRGVSSGDTLSPSMSLPRSRSIQPADVSGLEVVKASRKHRPLMLKNKSPRWHEQLQCWCLNFKGRVTVASVKNFQLVAVTEPSQGLSQADQDKVLLQFGKIGKDTFTMDYKYPLSAFQAFAICLSSFDTKLASE